MRLSAGVPAYNQGGFLRETLESLLRQERPFHEIVVSDNHSTDTTAEVIAAVAQEHPGRIRVIRPPKHLTMVENWNFTVGHLTGDWFTLLSSDDVALPNFVGAVERAAGTSPGVVLVRGWWKNIDAEGELVEERRLLSVTPLTRPPKTLYEQRFGPKGSFASFALKRAVWEQVGGFPEQVTLVSDWAMWLLAGARGEIATAREFISQYRMGHQSKIALARHHIHMREIYTIYSEILPRATEMGGFGRPAWIERASRQRLRQAIRGTSRMFATHERVQLTEAFREWAEATGEQKLLARFAAGEVMQEFNPLQRAKNAVRGVADAVLRAAGRGTR
jgi:glycosyltransferase involved in cell wall biosynthesis